MNLAGGLALAALGALVLLVRPRRRATMLFALFASAWGMGFVGLNLLRSGMAPEAWSDALYVLDALSFGTAACALSALALAFPEPLRERERRLLVLPGAIVLLALFDVSFRWERFAGWTSLQPYRTEANLVLTLAMFASIALFAQRAATTGLPPERYRQYAVLSVALAIFPTTLVAGVDGGEGDPIGEVALAAAIVSAVLWLRAGARGAPPRLARNVSWAILGLVVASQGYRAASGSPVSDVPGAPGLMRFVTAAAFGTAILRHQMLGLDVKVRFAISKSTIAATFVAVFFIASEAAQQFFGDRLESSYLGILAAGALVFAFAPLSRLADRIAETAVPPSTRIPVEGAPAASGALDRERAYRAAVRGYLRDGALTRHEERELAHLAGELGIHAGRAMEMRHEVEDEPRKTR